MKIAKHKVGGGVEVFEADPETAKQIESSYEKPDRRQEYNARGATIEALVIAMFENDAGEIARLEAIRQKVKTEIPKQSGIESATRK